jgi:hypothetical protein
VLIYKRAVEPLLLGMRMGEQLGFHLSKSASRSAPSALSVMRSISEST